MMLDPKGSTIDTDGQRWYRHSPPDIRLLIDKLLAHEIKPSELPMGDPRNAAVLKIWALLRADAERSTRR
jgi:hypothetical protein